MCSSWFVFLPYNRVQFGNYNGHNIRIDDGTRLQGRRGKR
jgi:hypothetical protein